MVDGAGRRPDATSGLGIKLIAVNGIAYDAKRDRLFVTGKQWPTVFEIKVVPR